MKKVVLYLAGILITLSAHAQSSIEKIDSLRKGLSESKRDAHQVQLLLQLAECYQTNIEQAGWRDSAVSYAVKAEALSRSLASKQLLGESLLARCTGLLASRENSPLPLQTSQTKRASTEAIKLFETIGDPLHKADGYYWLALSYSTEDTTRLYYLKLALADYKTLQAKSRIVKTLLQLSHQNTRDTRDNLLTRLETARLQLAIHDTTVVKTLFSIAISYNTLGDYPKALQYGHRFYQVARQLRQVDEINRANSIIAYIYETMGDNKRAVQFYQIALQAYQKTNDTLSMIQLQRRLCNTYLRSGQQKEALRLAQYTRTLAEAIKSRLAYSVLLQIGDCFAAQKDYRRAESYYAKALPEYAKSPSTKGTIYQALGKLYIATHRLLPADTCLKQAWLAVNQWGGLSERRDVALALYQVDSLRGNSAAALAHYQVYTALKDSLLNEAKNKQIVLMQVQFDTEKKDQEIKSLQDQRALQQARVDQAQLIRNLTFAGLGVLFVLLWISYNRYRHNQRLNQILETKQAEINQKNGSLEQLIVEKNQLLVEKDWMMKEIHHRVKNNLQVITSLLHSQSIYLKDPIALAAIRESQNRVNVMALSHQKLYQSDQLASIPMPEYIDEITNYLITVFNQEELIVRKLDIAPLNFSVGLAIPLGLIINEAMTNSLKHAFRNGQSGIIAIELTELSNQTYRLSISDNGIGLPADINPARSRTLGMSLIRGLSKQLGGNLHIGQNDGVQISLTFREEKIAHESTTKG